MTQGRVWRGELLRYAVAGGSAFLLDLAVYTALLRAGVPYLAAAAIGFLLGLAFIYGLSVRWAFSTRRIDKPAVEFAVFAAIGLMGLGLTQVLLFVLVEHAAVAPVPAKLVTSVIVFGFNFGVRKATLFTPRACEPALRAP